MSKKKKYIKYPKERAILSDVLPYEIPITFSNRYFYRFLLDNKIEVIDNNIRHKSKYIGDEKDAFEILIKILFSADISNPNFRKIPFTYRISHKKNDFRELALVHPINQLKLISFYDQFKELIIYSCSVSNYSIRRPDNVAKFSFFNDKLHQSNKGEVTDFLELSGKEYENLKTFFSYSKYTNIYRFYEDYRYQRAEKKYNYLFKFDISNCFYSIYTHSIVWAVLGLDAVKENVNESKKSFGGIFDNFIQYTNYGETNGILIGPEFSRIFAEIILQRIDKTVEDKLKVRGYFLKTQYELYRYVDDYFLFCDSESLKDEILVILKHELKLYKLAINDSKSLDYSKPIITEITIAKNKIIELFSDEPKFIISKIDSTNINNKRDENKDISLIEHNFNFYFDPNNLATKYKIIIKESKVDYKDVLNYSLAVLNNIIERNLINFENVIKEYWVKKTNEELSKSDLIKINKVEDSFATHIEGFIDFIFFIYSVSPRVNSTIKVCHILSKIIKFYKEKINTQNRRERVFKRILDESTFILNKNTLNEYAQIESLYLLTVLRDLGKEYRLPEQLLSKFINTYQENDILTIKKGTLNYFSIVVTFYYIGYSQKYPQLKNALIDYTFDYISSYPTEKRGKSSEIAHLMLDLFACPFVDAEFKKKILLLYRSSSTESDIQNTIIDAEKINTFHKEHKYWFTKWERFNLAKELENKKSQEVYS
ncbi:hypothetical protein GCM10011514_53390 [Emticicia aquatilis]|uniref:Reverse transcriptase domain-containing protein n=1 Tax=Emticicia aquatilis TaxID=1537369 RepID=A0A917DZU5_9BACT|nr:antiviral reverse transcriptase Drt3b [Emticicia aquatilis]GGD82635.1 hypothetical protein GCM10011514_53390 [Emticicia aquatilis]